MTIPKKRYERFMKAAQEGRMSYGSGIDWMYEVITKGSPEQVAHWKRLWMDRKIGP